MGEGSTDTPQGVGHGSGREAGHVPVLLKEAIDFLAIQRGGTYIDATVGLGGHSFEIARRLGAPGHLIGLDKDPAALEIARERLVVGQDQQQDWPEITLLHRSFAELANDEPRPTYDGILADLGMSSLQLNDAARGFSFQAEGLLDMRMNPQAERTAEQVVNQIDEVTLANLIYEFGEERRSRRIARAIVRSRPIRTTAQLAEVVSAAARPMNRLKARMQEGFIPRPNLSGSPNLRKRRIERPAGIARRSPAGAQTGRTVGDHQFSLAGGSHRKRCSPRRNEAGLLRVTDQEACDRRRRRD